MLNNFNPKTLVKSEHQQLIDDYFRYLDTGWKHYHKPAVENKIKKQKLDLLEKALRKDFPIESSLIARLQKAFVKENLSLYLLLDPIYAWRWPAAGKAISSEAQLSELINLFISPAARLIMALYDENPATYLPLSSLFAALFWLDLFNNKSDLLTKAKLSKRQRVSKVRGLLKSSAVILNVVNSKRLKFKLAICLNYARKMLKKFENNEQAKLSFLDNSLIFAYSFIQFLSVKHKTLEKAKL